MRQYNPLNSFNTATLLATASLLGCEHSQPPTRLQLNPEGDLPNKNHIIYEDSQAAGAERWRAYSMVVDGMIKNGQTFVDGTRVNLTPGAFNILIFADSHCPLAGRYVQKINELQENFANRMGAQFIMVFPKRGDTVQTINNFAQEYGAKFPVLLDTGAALADIVRAERSPEAFVFDKDIRIIYRGAIDDQEGIRGTKPQLKNDYLATVLENLATEKQFNPLVTDTEGCFLDRENLKRIYPTWTRDIAPLVEKHCAGCHNDNEIGSVRPLITAEHLADSAQTVLERVKAGVMPPWLAAGKHNQFDHDRRLDANEIWALKTWVEKGMPKGEGEYTIDPKKYTSQHHLQEHDIVIEMLDPNSDQPHFTIPAQGIIPYHTFIAPYVFEEDKWLVSSEVITPSPRSLHHISVFIVPPNEDTSGDGLEKSFFARAIAARRYGIEPSEYNDVLRFYGRDLTKQINLAGFYAPGEGRMELSQENGILIPKGSQLAFECHYVTIGKEVQDRSAIKLKFGEMPENAAGAKIITRTGAPRLGQIQIDPQGSQTITKTFPLFADAEIYGLRPHMHMRGKEYRCEIERPGEERMTVIHIPAWDINWERHYVLRERIQMPKGTKIHMTYTWDNSEQNPNNPDPEKKVTFGTSIFHEMGLSWLSYVYKNPAETADAEHELQLYLDDRSIPSSD